MDGAEGGAAGTPKPAWLTYALHCAETFDAWRVWPRILVAGLLAWSGWYLSEMLEWYMHMIPADRNGNVTGFAGVVTTAVTTLAGFAIKIYTDGGRDWVKNPA